MSAWKISINAATAVTLESLGITLASLDFVSHGPGKAVLEIAGAFDATAPIAYGDDVKIIRNDGSDVVVFRGRARTLPRWGSGTSEGYAIDIIDAWADLEETIYQENWQAYTDTGSGFVEGTHAMARALLGFDASGDPLDTAAFITEVIGYANSVDIAIQIGGVPTGTTMVPREVSNAFCAELISEALAYHPDWMTWIDYSTTPPTLHFVDRASATARSFPVDGTGDVAGFEIVRRDDLKPVRVIIQAETSGGISGLTPYRGLVVDMYPPAADPGPDPIPTEGPGVLVATLPGSGSTSGNPGTSPSLTTTKARIKTRAIPTSTSAAKAWLKIKYKHLADLADTDFNVTGFTRTLVTPDVADPDPVDVANPPPTPTVVGDVPNELIDGQITDWMQAMVGRVRIVPEITPSGTETEAERLLINRPLPPVTVLATDKSTGTYSNITSITYGSPPSGPAIQAGTVLEVAEDYYNALNQNTYEGSLTLRADDIPTDRQIGCAINVSGGLTEWATMRALCNRVAWDLQTARVTIGFGPPRWRTWGDYVATMDALRRGAGNPGSPPDRTAATFTFGEDEADQGFHTPETIFDVPEIIPGEGVIPFKLSARNDGGTLKWQVSSDYSSITDGTNGAAIDLGPSGADWGTGAVKFDVETTISATKYIVLEADADVDLTLTDWTLSAVALADADEVGLTGTPPAQNKIRLLIGKVTVDTTPDPDTVEVSQAVFTPQQIGFSILNGLAVKTFRAAPIHADNL